MSALYVGVAKLFQSTLSVRRATALFPQSNLPAYISIHALRKESDLPEINIVATYKFQSTLSVRRATCFIRRIVADDPISIHALRKESDMSHDFTGSQPDNFNPRSP